MNKLTDDQRFAELRSITNLRSQMRAEAAAARKAAKAKRNG